MPTPPPCKSLGRHCRELTVTVGISDIEDESPTLQEASVTWMTGHTERVTWGKPYVAGSELRVEATVHVPCKYLKTPSGKSAVRPDGTAADRSNGKRPMAHCSAHGFRGPLPPSTQPPRERRPRLILGEDRFSIYYKSKRRELDLRLKRAAKRALPVLQADNPCLGAPCRTGDNTRGSACCRDLTLEVFLRPSERRLEALLRARKAPYLCKVKREDDETMECEVISACGYLASDGTGCRLHDRILPNGQRAKPSLCYEWPDVEPDETGHPGCRLI
ncbi:MAG: hypothetical protein ACE5HT_00240 [Gemmatimonadales bacterium]